MLLRKFGVFVLCVAGLARGATIPRPAPDFAVNLNDGSQLHLSQYRGKVVVMAFILTYCSHCQFTSQILAKLQKEYGPRGFQVVASAIEDMASMAVPDFIQKFQPGYPVGFSQRDPVQEFLEHPAIYKLMMPQVVAIDRKGTIRAQFAGDDRFFLNEEQEKNFRDLLEPLLKEPVPHAAAHGKKTAP
jgi:peroxiredoxin